MVALTQENYERQLRFRKHQEIIRLWCLYSDGEPTSTYTCASGTTDKGELWTMSAVSYLSETVNKEEFVKWSMKVKWDWSQAPYCLAVKRVEVWVDEYGWYDTLQEMPDIFDYAAKRGWSVDYLP